MLIPIIPRTHELSEVEPPIGVPNQARVAELSLLGRVQTECHIVSALRRACQVEPLEVIQLSNALVWGRPSRARIFPGTELSTRQRYRCRLSVVLGGAKVLSRAVFLRAWQATVPMKTKSARYATDAELGQDGS
jgi:hypothetical protein